MPTDLATLQAIKTNLLAILSDLSSNPKPSYSIDGQSVSWSEYFSMVSDQLDKINALINAENPYCIVSQVQ